MKKTVFIFSDGELKRKDNTLCYETQQGRKFLPIEDINDILVFGEVTFNKQFVEFLSQKEVLVHYFNYHGYYMGTFYPREHMNSGYMILKQAEFYNDHDERLSLAKKFTEGAFKNIRQVIKYYDNRKDDFKETLTSIENIYEGISECETINQLMALEGHIREEYYKTFDKIIDNKDFIFVERSRRPPKNRLNALISFGNSLLYTIVLSEIYKTHLDPRIGFLHATNFRRFSLNLDVAEIFKPIIIDRLIFSLIGRKMISAKHFQKEGGGIMLNENGKKIFATNLDERLKTTIKHRELGRNVSYRRLIRMELYKIQKHLLEEAEYSPFVARW